MYHSTIGFLTPSAEAELPTESISGTISETLTKKRYTVTGDLFVATGTSCVVAAGSIFEFDADHKWTAEGSLALNGTASERIELKISAGNVEGFWRGIRCVEDVDYFDWNGPDALADFTFTYCDFSNCEKLDETVGGYHRTRGSALMIALYSGDTEITNCTFTDCTGYSFGGTIYLDGQDGLSTTFSDCTFTRCITTNEVAGAWVVVHSTYSVSGMTYIDCEGQLSDGAYGPAATFTANTSTDQLNMGGTHYMITGNIVTFAATSNAPAPCVGGTPYYAIYVSSSNVRLATNYENANAGTYIDLTATPTGSSVCATLQEFAATDATVTITA